ncbi:hypothetical protein M378DRAFT_1029734 [Amanita muscaria Koide BX008]|uniref:Uncharacterized protein n=1 Tax=Amanita muscaria (strain Koide BX008) TaxID=946122 RepID=A0A0C2WKF2_AMAMK|nr:hypothetical protein M378DRAFT_1029734 [Amanita muscaria Koide BX008]
MRGMLKDEAQNVKDTNLREFLLLRFVIHRARCQERRWQGKSHSRTTRFRFLPVLQRSYGVLTCPRKEHIVLGRTSNPQYDTFEEDVVILNHWHNFGLLNQQLMVKGQIVSKLADRLNAEIVLGTTRNRRSCARAGIHISPRLHASLHLYMVLRMMC